MSDEMRAFKTLLKSYTTVEERKDRERDKVRRRIAKLEEEMQARLDKIDTEAASLTAEMAKSWPEELQGQPVSFRGLKFVQQGDKVAVSEDKVIKLG